MKHKILLLILAVTLGTSISEADPIVRWLGTKHSFGAIDENVGMVACVFQAVNDGDEPLVVLNARANCGCTTPSYRKTPIAPGDTLRITVGFDPKGRPGRFEKYIRVETNSEPKRSELTISGSVIATRETASSRYPVDLGCVRIRDKVVSFGEVVKGKTVGAYIEGYNVSHDTICPRIGGLPGHLTVRLEPSVVPPGEQFVISTVANSYRTTEWGIVSGDFDFYPDATAPATRLSTVMVIKEDFSGMTPEQMRDAPVADIIPNKLDMGTINPNQKAKPIETTFEIKNTGKNQLIVRSVKSLDEDVVVVEGVKPDMKIKKDKSLKVKVKVDPAKLSGRPLLNAQIVVVTNDPEDPSQKIRVVGEIAK